MLTPERGGAPIRTRQIKAPGAKATGSKQQRTARSLSTAKPERSLPRLSADRARSKARVREGSRQSRYGSGRTRHNALHSSPIPRQRSLPVWDETITDWLRCKAQERGS